MFIKWVKAKVLQPEVASLIILNLTDVEVFLGIYMQTI